MTEEIIQTDREESGEHERLEESGLFGPGFIHEMRHPLTGIKAGLQLIARQLGPAVTSLEDWQLVITQVARMEELFRSYEQLFGSQSVPPSRFELEPLLERAVELVAWRVRRLGPRFQWMRPAAVHMVTGIPGAVLHAVVNLLVNAVDAVEEAGGAGRVALRVIDAPLQVRVADDGNGIPAEDAERIFEPRFTTKAPGKGTGLGLHIARQAMKRAGGTVRMVGAGDPLRLPWARTEFAVEIEPPP